MALEKPTNSKELRYFTRKTLEGGGKATIWVFAPKCTSCNEGRLLVPYNEENGRYNIRAKNFICNKCGNEEPKADYKLELPVANITYTCPHCKASGEKQEAFKRTKKGDFKFICDLCGKTIDVRKSKKK